LPWLLEQHASSLAFAVSGILMLATAGVFVLVARGYQDESFIHEEQPA